MKKTCMLLAVAGAFIFPVHAQGGNLPDKQSEVLKQLLATYADKAKEDARKRNRKTVPAFSVEAGREFYLKRRTWQETDYTCSGCHTENPARQGRHFETGKVIKPLAPAANPDRFLDAAKVEKSFSMHCQDLYERDCNAEEKGHFITYLMSVK